MRYLATAVAGWAVCGNCMAQQPVELQVYGGGGLSQLHYKLKGGKTFPGFGGQAGMGVTFFFNRYLGLHTGAEASWYNARVKADGLQAYSPNRYDDYQNDDEIEKMKYSRYHLTSALRKYVEKQKALLVNIPIALHFQTVGRFKYYFLAGFKVGIPVRATYSVSGATVYNGAYYPEADNTHPEDLVNHLSGFGLFEERTFQEALPLRVSLAAAFETGMKFHLAEKIFLYWGLYCDYGINDIREKKGLEYINRVDGALIGRDFIPNSLIVSHAAPEEAFAKRVVPLSAGLRLRLGFGLGKSKPKAEATDAVSALTPAQKAELEKQRQLDAAEKRRLRGEVADLQQRLADAEQAKQEAETNAQQLADELMALKPTDISDEEFQQDMETIEQSISDVNENDSSAMINYFTNRTEITENQKTKLDAKIAILEKYPNLKIYCIGHTDDIGSDQGNIALGMRRAQGVKDYLVSGGIASERIIVQSRGKSEPLVANTSDFNRARNRRVEITVVR